MMYNENLHEEEQHLIQQIAEQTERGKIDWELTEYNPLSFLNEDKIDKNPAVICQSFSFEAIIGGSRYELDVMENIDVPSGMGDYTITLTRDETEIILKLRMRFPLTVTAMNAHRRKSQSDLRTAPLSASATPSFLPRLGRRI